ncbi:hypothetical protein PAEPH01_0695 [Pancytospora epiphaga]|nr:hypothetical protein PAEPH01_0695 [Pancytospora epiphaga]
MNPFSNVSCYDNTLADIIERLGRHPVELGTLKELLVHLPKIDLETELAAIKLVIKPLFRYNCPIIKKVINYILTRIIKELGSSENLQDLASEWLYYNFDAEDEFAKKIRLSQFRGENICDELYERIDWDNQLRALSCFVFLIENSKTEYSFDISKLVYNSNHVFDQIYRILSIIVPRIKTESFAVNRNSLNEFTNSGCVSSSSPFIQLYFGIFTQIVSLHSDIFIPKKYKILLDLYNYSDKAIYDECRCFTNDNYESLLFASSKAAVPIGLPTNILYNKQIEYDNLRFSSVTQLELLLGRVENKEKFLLLNLDCGINLFELFSRVAVDSAFIVRNKTALVPYANESILDIYKRYKAGEKVGAGLGKDVLDIVCGTHKIIAARLLDVKLDPSMFTKHEIESVFDCSVYVFSLGFLTSTEFDCSCAPLLKAYQCDVEKVFSLYKKTPLEDLVFYIKDANFMKQLVLSMDNAECFKSYEKIKQKIEQKFSGNTGNLSSEEVLNYRLIWNVFLYRLRGKSVEPVYLEGDFTCSVFDVDYDFAFEHFFSFEYILFLAKGNKNREGLLRRAVKHLQNANISTTTYYTGYNFDDQKQFYSNVTIPAEDKVLKVLLEVYRELKKKNIEEIILFYLLEISLYKQISIDRSGEILEYIGVDSSEYSTFINNTRLWPVVFDLGPNCFLFERLLRQLFNIPAKVSTEILFTGKIKAIDVLLREGALGWRHMIGINPTFLSLEGLKVCVDLLVDKGEPITTEFSEYVEGMIETGDNIDFIQFIESDDCLKVPYLKEDRLAVYERVIDVVSGFLSDSLVNSYSMAKLDSRSDDSMVFELMTLPFAQAKSMFWLLIVRALYKTNNLYISLFVEDFILKYLTAGATKDNNGEELLARVCTPNEYLEQCTEEELEYFLFVFPTLYKGLHKSLGLKRKANIEKFVRAVAEKKIENSRISFYKMQEAYQLKMTYSFDSMPYTATMRIPIDYPFSYPKLEFDYENSKCPKFYLRINELLKRSSKFVEIFIQWKVNLDNRFVGHKECLICYYVLEPKMRTFSDFECLNCHNKFHKKCIYEWIRTSKNSQCPLCRVAMKIW